jgi:hypothetical protein
VQLKNAYASMAHAVPGVEIALPSPLLATVYLVKRRLPRRGEVYILVSTLLASSSLLWEAIVLATRQR